MSALATSECLPRELSLGVGGEPMLDEVLVGVWEGLTARRAVACPVCGGEMQAEVGFRGHEVIGRCGACGSTVA